MQDKKQRLRSKRKVRSPKSILFDKVWDKCSEYVRRRDDGQCFTCPDKKDWKLQHAGHFRHGKTKATYFDDRQIRCQCIACNHFRNGNLGIYGVRLTAILGAKKVEQIITDSYKQKDWKMAELTNLHEYFLNKLEELE